jgi:protein TonB
MRRYAYFSSNSLHFHLRMLLLSVLGAAFIFILIPLVEQALRQVNSMINVRPVEVQRAIVRPIPPPPPQLEKEVKRIKVRSVAKPKIRTKTQRTIAPAKIKASLSLDMMSKAVGDFALNFDVEPTLEDTELIFQLEEVQQAPVVIKKVNPIYPFKAKDRGVEGEVVLFFVVGSDGAVQEDTIEISEAKPGVVFNEAAVNAVKQWRFEPGRMNKQPVAVLMTVTLVFNLS